jgi:hypothetical protein
MKKVALFFLILLIVIACTPKEDGGTTQTIDRTKLSRLIYYPGKSNEVHWHFNSKGLLEKKTKPDGTLIQSFEYSAQNNLISSTDYENGVAKTTDRYTYDAQNHITSFRGFPVTYDALENSYTLKYGEPDSENLENYKMEIELNSEGLFKRAKNFYSVELGFIYTITSPIYGSTSDNNLSGFSDNGISGYSCLYDNKINPIKESVLAICKVAIFYIDIYSSEHALGQLPKLWILPQCYSNNNVIRTTHVGDFEPEWVDNPTLYDYKFNDLNLPVSRTKSSYGTSEIEILYYYQGDIIP